MRAFGREGCLRTEEFEFLSEQLFVIIILREEAAQVFSPLFLKKWKG